jgi:hypothetical protein
MVDRLLLVGLFNFSSATSGRSASGTRVEMVVALTALDVVVTAIAPDRVIAIK